MEDLETSFAATHDLSVVVRLRSGSEERHGPFLLGRPVESEGDGSTVSVGDTFPWRVLTSPRDGSELATVTYEVRTPMRNFEYVIGPDSGRWFMNTMHVTGFWKFGRTASSRIGDVKVPLWIFTAPDGGVAEAIGVVGRLAETDFELIEPVSGRALNVHTGGVTVRIQRGSDTAPLTAPLLEDSGAFEEWIYAGPGLPERGSWVDALRDLSDRTRSAFGRKDRFDAAARDPFWCSWVDWASADVDERMVEENVGLGVGLGIRNFILDDGWFGPGLDSAYTTPLNIGDWTPDTSKFPDLLNLTTRVRELGGRLIIWCAPHAVGPAALCWHERYPLLQANADGEPVIGETQFASLCFRSPEARAVMVEVCRRLATEYGFDGAKYDLFNWVPDVVCHSPHHRHDTDSMIEGLALTLEGADEAVRAVAPDYVVELKQNYGTALLSPFGSCMRAGDAPFDPRTNFLRTMHVQSYTANALNDYQTFGPEEEPEEIAVAVILMLAAGIPAYGSDLSRLTDRHRSVLQHLHHLYERERTVFSARREPEDAALSVIRARGPEADAVMLTGSASTVRAPRRCLILNGGRQTAVHLEDVPVQATITISDPSGTLISSTIAELPIAHISVPIGGSVEVRPSTNDR